MSSVLCIDERERFKLGHWGNGLPDLEIIYALSDTRTGECIPRMCGSAYFDMTGNLTREKRDEKGRGRNVDSEEGDNDSVTECQYPRYIVRPAPSSFVGFLFSRTQALRLIYSTVWEVMFLIENFENVG